MKKYISLKSRYLPVAILTLLFVANIANATGIDPTRSLISRISGWVNALVPIAIALALVAFFYGLAKFIFNNASSDAKDDGKRIMIWGVVALFVMVSVWGLVSFIQRSTGVNGGAVTPITIPEIRQQR